MKLLLLQIRCWRCCFEKSPEISGRELSIELVRPFKLLSSSTPILLSDTPSSFVVLHAILQRIGECMYEHDAVTLTIKITRETIDSNIAYDEWQWTTILWCWQYRIELKRGLGSVNWYRYHLHITSKRRSGGYKQLLSMIVSYLITITEHSACLTQ